MLSICIGVLFLFFNIYAASASHFQFHEFYHEETDQLPFQNEIEGVFHAFVKGDIERMEKTFKFLENIDPKEFNKLDDLNYTTDYTAERINYVVSLQ